MRSLYLVTGFSLLRSVTAQDTDDNGSIQIVNLINPLWALPNGDNSTRGLGASVVNVDSTAITYAVSCDATAELIPGPTPISCIWETVGPQLFTQWATSQHFTLRTSGFSDVASYTGDYTFPSTLAPTITGAFSLSKAIASQDPNFSGFSGGINTNLPVSTTTTLQSGTTTDAVWYPIPITAGEEKLLAAFSSMTGRASPRPSLTAEESDSAVTTTTRSALTAQSTATPPRPVTTTSASEAVVTEMSSTSLGSAGSGTAATSASVSTNTVAAAAERVVGKVGWFGALVGGVLGVFVL
ncbi:hypothetical protein VTL71DRAFT_15275 [Oculimacula yallundae]|uniref:Uncharacterized protein n=1 Tax=Oculimacula yallundae TaxID=86028 RepID=A0ABR4CGU6_9HELO